MSCTRITRLDSRMQPPSNWWGVWSSPGTPITHHIITPSHHTPPFSFLYRYNNRTYRIDDIAWDKNPRSTFMDHTGKAVSFVDYYKYMCSSLPFSLSWPVCVSVCITMYTLRIAPSLSLRRAYDKAINDKEQPLLIHRPKKRDKLNKDVSPSLLRCYHTIEYTYFSISFLQAPDEVICLVPELCCMTGLTDYARSDFRVMKVRLTHTTRSRSNFYSVLPSCRFDFGSFA